MQKNVCLCRHFQRLNKHSALGQLRKSRNKRETISRSDSSDGFNDLWRGSLREGKKSFLDVWLVDFFSPTLSTNTSDTTSLFILQLACIVNMVPRWKKLKIRVFIIKPSAKSLNIEETNSNDVNIPEEEKEKREAKNKDAKLTKEEKELKDMLNLLRISAETHLIPWYTLEEYSVNVETSTEIDIGASEGPADEIGTETRSEIRENVGKVLQKKSLLYLKATCEMVRSRSSETAVTFLYLPEPPVWSHDTSTQEEKATKADNYLTNLEVLTNHWPPTLLVRGVSPVTSTTL